MSFDTEKAVEFEPAANSENFDGAGVPALPLVAKSKLRTRRALGRTQARARRLSGWRRSIIAVALVPPHMGFIVGKFVAGSQVQSFSAITRGYSSGYEMAKSGLP